MRTPKQDDENDDFVVHNDDRITVSMRKVLAIRAMVREAERLGVTLEALVAWWDQQREDAFEEQFPGIFEEVPGLRDDLREVRRLLIDAALNAGVH